MFFKGPKKLSAAKEKHSFLTFKLIHWQYSNHCHVKINQSIDVYIKNKLKIRLKKCFISFKERDLWNYFLPWIIYHMYWSSVGPHWWWLCSPLREQNSAPQTPCPSSACVTGWARRWSPGWVMSSCFQISAQKRVFRLFVCVTQWWAKYLAHGPNFDRGASSVLVGCRTTDIITSIT